MFKDLIFQKIEFYTIFYTTNHTFIHNYLQMEIFYNLLDARLNAPSNSYIVFYFQNAKTKFLRLKNIGMLEYICKSSPYLHEVLLKPDNSLAENTFYNRCDGRLVFDLDFNKFNYNATNFVNDFQNAIINVAQNLYKNIDTGILHFVWSTSNNPYKFSKHLTVKNLLFEDWINMSLQFYDFLQIYWTKTHDYVKFNDIIDHQILTANHNLRMVGCFKPDGTSQLMFDGNYTLWDSIVRPAQNFKDNLEQKIHTYQLQIMPTINLTHTSNSITHTTTVKNAPNIPNSSNLLAAYDYNFTKNIGNEIYHYYRRHSSAYCKLCDRKHDSDNVFVKQIHNKYIFYCFRNLNNSFVLNNVDNIKSIKNIVAQQMPTAKKFTITL